MYSQRHITEGSPLRGIAKLRHCRRGRYSSWDQTGKNNDSKIISPQKTLVVANPKKPGCITHIWCTVGSDEPFFLRKVLLRAFWDKENEPSIEVPIGDFFGIGHGLTKNFSSLPLTMDPQNGRAFNCFFPMPFKEEARIEVKNQGEHKVKIYYYIDYEEYDDLSGEWGRFHAQWRRQNPCQGIDDSNISNEEFEFGGQNITGEDNYIILEAAGKGHYVGCSLNIENLRETEEFNWYGEGDDMIFIDGESFPPSLHGTGTEDYFDMSACPSQEFCSPYHGLPLPGGPNWSGKITLYRFHIEDPICFEKSIRVTIEHGHANRRSDDYSSVAYWYQTEPHKTFPKMLPPKKRLPSG